ncbi:hypothetical protein ACH5RR_029584 [Cinchona calisaya]|uniref:NB-ARC domain-containing protein n=1 Tax=Cinchona calisaya TaxID=153742 RepID=A0ABD2YXA9_9GENT
MISGSNFLALWMTLCRIFVMEFYQCLKGKRYLIVLDDMWSIEPWNDLERSFSNDGNGSRILITSRLPDVASRIKVDSIPYPLCLLLMMDVRNCYRRSCSVQKNALMNWWQLESKLQEVIKDFFFQFLQYLGSLKELT